MSEDFIKREEYNDSIGRLHDKQNDFIQKSIEQSTRIETSVKHQEGLVDKMHGVIYGNGKEGLLSKVSNLFTRVAVNRWLLGIILVCVITTAFLAIRNNLLKVGS